MANLREIGEALAVLVSSGTPKEKITVLHCNTEYPTPMRDVNLKVMNSIKEKIGVRVGYSDHTQGIEVSVAAAALGAEVIEKHFTLDRTLSGPDHRASLEPGELKTMVKAIRNIEKALGNGIKKITGSEKKNKVIARKSIVAARVIDKDELLTEDNITTKRPGTGLSPMKWDEVIGARATRDYQLDEEIVLS
jgi:N,N'-diacetyllegionaminate synthase